MKKRILTIALVVALLATCFAGSYAYLMDSEAQTNTFTTGTVYITLDEAEVEKDENTGNLIAKKDDKGEVVRTSEEQNYKLFPAMTVTKDPTIYLDENSEDAWVAAKITITGDVLELIKNDFSAIASGGELFGSNVTVEQITETGKVTLYVLFNEKQSEGAELVLFTTLTIPANWGNEEMVKVNGMEIKVEAFAVQANGFDTCELAMTTAYESAFAAIK